MVETITPVVHGGSGRRWAVSAGLHTAGAALSSAALGASLGALGALLGAPWGGPGMLAVAAVAGAYAAGEALGVPVPLPDRRRQVPEWWRTFFSPHTAAFLYGAGLGVGFLTYLSHGTLVAVAVAAVALGEPGLGALVVVPFGLARGLSLLAVGPQRSAEAAAATVDRLEARAATVLPRAANAAALAAVAGGAAAAAVEHLGDGLGTASPAAALAVAGAFAWAAASKVLRPPSWHRALAAHRLGPWPERAARLGLPLAEAAVPALVVSGRPHAGAALSLALLAAFSAATLRARALHGDRLPCGCFGRSGTVEVRALLLRNAALAVLAGLALAGPPAEAPLPGGLTLPGPGEALPALLVAGGIALGLWAVRQTVTALRGRRP